MTKGMSAHDEQTRWIWFSILFFAKWTLELFHFCYNLPKIK